MRANRQCAKNKAGSGGLGRRKDGKRRCAIKKCNCRSGEYVRARRYMRMQPDWRSERSRGQLGRERRGAGNGRDRNRQTRGTAGGFSAISKIVGVDRMLTTAAGE